MTSKLDKESAEYVFLTQPLDQQTREQFVLRIVYSFNQSKDKIWNDSFKS